MGKETKKQRIILYSIIVTLIILVIVIMLLLLLLPKEKEMEGNVLNTIEDSGENFLNTYGGTEEGGIEKQTYFDVMSCVRQYLSAINIKNDAYYTYDENGDYVLAVDEEIIKEKIYNLLSQKYINQNDITLQNLYDKIETTETSGLFVPIEISMIQNSDIKSFLVHGLLESSSDYSVIDQVFIIVNIDIVNTIYSIEPIDGEYNSIQEIEVNQLEDKIEANENNKFSTSYATDEESVKDYINLYKRLALGYPERMYQLLDEEYKTAKFGNLENFIEYVETNKNSIIGINPQSYQVERDGDYTQYVCIDQNGKYYIFREESVMDYTVILDTYTIDLPEFVEEYERASDEDKVLMNIQRFFDAIEDGDYRYAYNKLDETFKTNNFATLEEFENYAKTNFFKQNTLSAGKAEKQGNVYLYNVTISDTSGESNQAKTTSFVMQLKEGTDFVMSFGI